MQGWDGDKWSNGDCDVMRTNGIMQSGFSVVGDGPVDASQCWSGNGWTGGDD